MDFTLKPSLQHLAIVKVVSALNIQVNIYYMEKYTTESEMCYEIEKKVIKILEKLQLPEFLKGKMLETVRPMISEIAYWKDRHYGLPISIWRKDFIRWTPVGAVDYKKTAEVLIEYEELGITERYDIACRFCLEDEIPKLWAKLSKREKEKFIDESDGDPGYFDTSRFWTWRMRGESCSNDIPEIYSWRFAFETGENKEFTEYALQKLTPAEKEESLIRNAEKAANSYRCREKRISKILFFLLSQVSEEQRIVLLQKFPYGILMSLLLWPWQNLFLDTAERLWDYLPLEDYFNLNASIIDRASGWDHYCYKDYDYKSLYREFWQRSPMTYKNYIFDKFDSPKYEFLKIEDENKSKRILKDTVSEFIINLIEKDDWNSLSDLFV